MLFVLIDSNWRNNTNKNTHLYTAIVARHCCKFRHCYSIDSAIQSIGTDFQFGSIDNEMHTTNTAQQQKILSNFFSYITFNPVLHLQRMKKYFNSLFMCFERISILQSECLCSSFHSFFYAIERLCQENRDLREERQRLCGSIRMSQSLDCMFGSNLIEILLRETPVMIAFDKSPQTP